MTWTRANNLDPTVMSSEVVAAPQSNTDALVYDSDYTNFCGLVWHSAGSPGTVGHVQCTVAFTTGVAVNKCDVHEIRFDTSYTDSASTTYLRNLACHENGHAVALKHIAVDASCLATPLSGSTAYLPHDSDHINFSY